MAFLRNPYLWSKARQMSLLSSFGIHSERSNPFPYDITAVRHARDIDLSNPVTFFIGDNGTGKSTLLETLAFRLQLPHMDGVDYSKSGFEAARTLVPHLELQWQVERPLGFFFRAEDFGDLLNSVHREDTRLHGFLDELEGEVPGHIIQQMKDNANYQRYQIRRDYGQDLQGFSHGEAYLKVMEEKLANKGIFLLDEPEAALSPSKQLSLLYLIKHNLESNLSQFIIATHSPILMAYPGAALYEISEAGMHRTDFKDTEHYMVTKSFLDNPEAYLRHLQ